MTDSVRLTRRELDIMSVLWRRGSATVAEVRDDLADDLAYPTVQTMLRVLEGKDTSGTPSTDERFDSMRSSSRTRPPIPRWLASLQRSITARASCS